ASYSLRRCSAHQAEHGKPPPSHPAHACHQSVSCVFGLPSRGQFVHNVRMCRPPYLPTHGKSACSTSSPLMMRAVWPNRSFSSARLRLSSERVKRRVSLLPSVKSLG